MSAGSENRSVKGNRLEGVPEWISRNELNAAWRINNRFTLRLGLNKVTNRQCFTKRPTFYPGPGIWSSDGRGGQDSMKVRL